MSTFRRIARLPPWALLIPLAMLAGWCGAVYLVDQAPLRVATALRTTIADAEETRAVQLLSRFERFDDATAIPHLVDLLYDQRESVAVAACDALRRRMIDWSDMPTAVQDRSAEVLARELASRPTPTIPRLRIFVREVGGRLLGRPMEQADVDLPAYLQNCAEIVRKSFEGASEDAVSTETKEPTIAGPLAEWNVPDPPRDDAELVMPQPKSDPTFIEPPPYDREEPGALQKSGDERLVPPNTFAPEPSKPLSLEVAPATFELDLEALRSLETRSLIRRLHDLPIIVEAAEQELRRRGFNAASLQLARDMDHPDPHIRRRLVEALPRIAGIDAKNWLLELARDEDPEVSRAARNTLLTGGNRETLSRLRGEAGE